MVKTNGLTFTKFLGILLPILVSMQAVVWGLAFIVVTVHGAPDNVPIFDDSPFVRAGWWGWTMVVGGLSTAFGLISQIRLITRIASFSTACLFLYGAGLSLDSEFATLWSPLLLSHFIVFGYIHTLATVHFMDKIGEAPEDDRGIREF